jgi:hypothetical protein
MSILAIERFHRLDSCDTLMDTTPTKNDRIKSPRCRWPLGIPCFGIDLDSAGC